MHARIVVSLIVSILCFGLAVGTVGCDTNPDGTASADVGAALTEAEVNQFTDQLEKAAETGIAAAVLQSLDLDALGDTALAKIELSAKSKQKAMQGLKAGMTKAGSFGEQIAEITEKGGTFRLLRAVTVDGKQRARFRTFMPKTAGINYMDFVLARREGGMIKAVDVYLLGRGEMLSASLYRLMLLGAQRQGLLAHIREEDKVYLESANAFDEMATAQRQGNSQEAIRRYHALPEAMKKEKMAQLIRLEAAMSGDKKVYEQALEQFRRDFAGDPAADLMGINYYYLRKDYNKALEMVDRLDKAIGGDTVLNVARLEALDKLGRKGEIIPLLQKTVQAMPDYVLGHKVLIKQCLEQKIYEPIAASLKKLAELGEDAVNPEAVDDPLWKAYARSPQYRKWRQSEKSP